MCGDAGGGTGYESPSSVRTEPAKRTVQLQASSFYGLADIAQGVLCGVGYTEIKQPDGSTFNVCEQPLSNIASAFLPTFTVVTPYQETTVPASQYQGLADAAGCTGEPR